MTEHDILAHYHRIQAHASADPNFKALCMSNPAAAIKQATGIEIPDDMPLSFIEGKNGLLQAVLPHPTGELSDQELVAIAAGSTAKCPPLQSRSR